MGRSGRIPRLGAPRLAWLPKKKGSFSPVSDGRKRIFFSLSKEELFKKGESQGFL